METYKDNSVALLHRIKYKFLFVVIIGLSICGNSWGDDSDGFVVPDKEVSENPPEDSFWDSVTKAAKIGAEKVKEVSTDVGKNVSDKAVDVWGRAVDAYDEYSEDSEDYDEREDQEFERSSEDHVVPQTFGEDENLENPEETNYTDEAGRKVGELWGDVVGVFSSGNEETSNDGLWDEINIELGDIAGKLQKQETLPDSAWVGEDKESNRKKINSMLEGVLEILQVSNVSERREEYEKLENMIIVRNKDIVLYREKMVTAPKKVSTVEKVWSNTVQDYKDKIHAAKVDIINYKDRQQLLLTAIQTELRDRSGIVLTHDQVYSLVVMVSGDSFIRLNSIFYNIRQLVVVLEELVKKNQDYISTINKYYGMYAVLVEALKMSHEVEIDRIRNNYLPKIDEYRVRAQLASEDTEKLIEKNRDNEQHVAMLEGNLQAQAQVSAAAREYAEYLKDYLVNIEESKRIIDRQLDVVLDTWKTTQLASGLLLVMQSSSAGLNDLVSMKLPDIQPLDIGRLKEQFSSISMELRK